MIILIILAYMFPVMYLPRIIVGLLRKEFIGANGIIRLKKIWWISLIYLVINIIFWYPHFMVGGMALYSGSRPISTETKMLFDVSLWSPVFSLLCSIISSIALKIYRKH
ncbi:MAG: hypothetical protein K0R93_1560 [Anaerosolibacter sp.]|jgi:hypothetical protein|nr:hypothetical protein [Anaerosolibacter sp.]